MGLTLVIGNKNYSSWSLRPWIAMKIAGIPFTERLVPFHSPDFRRHAQSAWASGKVPLLIDGETEIWESLAILEYLAERFPDAALWPAERGARACARAVANEMHAGFDALRGHLPMNMWRPVKARELPANVAADVARIETIWRNCRARFDERGGGPFLFGGFGAADAMYAPVVARLHTYAVPVAPDTRGYMKAVMALPAWREWRDAALAETAVVPEDEVDWPDVLRV
jgi:glutathione S-transferase